MATNDTSLWGKLTVSPPEIESELRRIWREAAAVDIDKQEKTSGERTTRVKATLANIIIFTTKSDSPTVRSRIDSLITELCIAHPARFFIVSLEPSTMFPKNGVTSGEDKLETLQTAVSSRCVLTESGAHVCSEEVYLSAHPTGISLVPNLLTSLFVADVEILLILLSTPPVSSKQNGLSRQGKFLEKSDATKSKRSGNDSELFFSLLSSLEHLSDRVIYDSAQMIEYVESTKSLFHFQEASLIDEQAGMLEPLKTSFPLFSSSDKSLERKQRDSTWHRLKRWRNLIASQCNIQGYHDQSAKISFVSLASTHSAKDALAGNLCAETLLLAGWFLSCLRWEPKGIMNREDATRIQILCEDKKGEMSTLQFQTDESLSEVQPELGMNQLSRVGFMIQGENTALDIQIRRFFHEASAEITTEFLSKDEAEKKNSSSRIQVPTRRVPFPALREHQLLLADIISGTIDKAFQEALERSLQLGTWLKNAPVA